MFPYALNVTPALAGPSVFGIYAECVSIGA